MLPPTQYASFHQRSKPCDQAPTATDSSIISCINANRCIIPSTLPCNRTTIIVTDTIIIITTSSIIQSSSDHLIERLRRRTAASAYSATAVQTSSTVYLPPPSSRISIATYNHLGCNHITSSPSSYPTKNETFETDDPPSLDI